jgi:hypothetical protein
VENGSPLGTKETHSLAGRYGHAIETVKDTRHRLLDQPSRQSESRTTAPGGLSAGVVLLEGIFGFRELFGTRDHGVDHPLTDRSRLQKQKSQVDLVLSVCMAVPRVVSTKYAESVSAVVRDGESRPVSLPESTPFAAAATLPLMVWSEPPLAE